MGRTQVWWIAPVLWLLLAGNSLMLMLSDLVHWFPLALFFLIQLLYIVQELRGRSMISGNRKANVIGMLIALLVEGFIFIMILPNAVD